MTTAPASLSHKILRRAGFGLLAALALIAVLVVVGKIWLEHRFLRQEFRIGEGSLRIHGGELNWALQFRFDSAWYRSPGLLARLGKTEVHPGLPLSAKVKVDTAFVRLISTVDTASPSPDEDSMTSAIAFPDFKLPIPFELKVRAMSIENDSGALVSARNIEVRNPTPQQIKADIGMLRSPLAKNWPCSVSAGASWSASDSVDLEVTVLHDRDRVHLQTRHARTDLLRGHGSVEALAFLDSLPQHLSPQKVEARVDWLNEGAEWQIDSRGKAGEELSLRGKAQWIQLPESDSSAPIWRHFTASVQGYARNVRVRAGGKNTRAEVRLEQAEWDGNDLSVRANTGDHSRVQVQARQTDGNWSGKFSLRIQSDERWVKVFADTSISFAALVADGTVRGKTITASVKARKISAYGFHLDSLESSHRYGPGGYELNSSRLYAGEETWTLSGKVEPATPSPILNFRLENPQHGRLEYVQDRDQTLHVTADQFEIAALPYDRLAKLPVQNPVLDASFQWNVKRRTGALDARVAAEFREEKVGVQAKAHWDAQHLEMENVQLNLTGSSLNVHARLKLHGRQFYELNKLRLPDYESVSLETPRFDLAHALSLFQPRPFLKSGEMQGDFSYADAEGFKGSLAFNKVVPTAEIGDVVLKRLQIDGTGDSLIVLGVTTSESTPLLRDSLRIAVAHVLESRQEIRVDAVAADSLHLRMDAVSVHLKTLQGRIQIQGTAPLPEGSGVLDRLHVDMDFSIPFQNTLAKATLTARTFEGDYAIPPATRQHFTLAPVLAHGILKVPRLTLKDEQGRSLQGDAEYVFKSNALHARLSGSGFALQWTENRRIAVRGLDLEYSMDSGGVRIRGGFSEASVLYVKPPLHAEGDLSTVSFSYTQPPKSRIRTEKKYPALQFSGALSQSLIRYRIKSLSELQNLFKKEGNKKRGGGRVHPMQMDVRLHTRGDSNRVDSDILRMTWVGDVQMRGLYPFALVQGRINSTRGELGIENQAYKIRQFEAKWLNAPLEEGEVWLEARKNLASHCSNSPSGNSASQDSCVVITRLQGPLSQLQFSYDTDCGGAFGAGASVAALLYSVQRGCYDPAFANGGGPGYGGKALSLLEPTVNNSLSRFVGRHTYSWIAQTEITGLSSLASHDSASDSLTQALSLQVTSKEFLRFRLKLRSGYHVESQDLSNPWENMLALEWWPPVQDYVHDPDWRRRLDRHVNVSASVQTVPQQRNMLAREPVQKILGINYFNDFWGLGWGKPARIVPKKDTASQIVEKVP